MATRPVVDSEGARRADLAAIHIAKKALGWSDDFYHDVLRIKCRVESSAELDFTGRKIWRAHLEAAVSQLRGTSGKDRKPLSQTQRKIWALWQQLADRKMVEDRKMPGLLAFVKRQTGVDRLEWLAWPQETLVIESLKAWLKRGTPPETP